MAAIGEKDIKALIRNGDIGGAFLFFGTESYLKEFYSSKLKDKAVSPDFADFNIISSTARRVPSKISSRRSRLFR